MKKKLALLPLLSLILLSGCEQAGSMNSSTTAGTEKPIELTDTLLTELGKAYSLENLVTEEVNGESSQFYSDSFYKDDKFTVKVYESKQTDPDKTVLQLFETYSADEEGRLVAERRNLNNTASYTLVYNPVLQEYTQFSDNYTNFFSFLKLSDFDLENGEYILKDTAIEEVSPYLVTQLYGNPGFELASFKIMVSDGLTYEAVTEPYQTTTRTYNYHFAGKILAYGDEVEVEERAEPYESVEDSVFETAFDNLKKQNYVLTQSDYQNDELVSTSTFIAAGDLTYRENTFDGVDYKIAAYKNGDKYFEADKQEDGTFLLTREITSEEYAALFPSFSVNPACFDKISNQYVVKDDISDSISKFSHFSSLTDEIDELTIDITNTKISVTNISGADKTVIEYTSIGSADVGYTLDDIKESSSSTWGELLDEASYANLSSVLGEAMSSFPVPEGFDMPEAWIDFGEEGSSMLVYLSSTPEANNDSVTAYGEQLLSAGYTEVADAEHNFEGSLVYSKETTANTLIVEIGAADPIDLGLGDAFDFPVFTILVMAL